MFGGVGVYFDGTFFAIIARGTIYLKTSEESCARFAAEGAAPFSYTTKAGRTQLTSYWRLPDRLLDEADELREWAQAAVASAHDAANKKKGQSRPKSAASRKANRKGR